MIKYIAHLQTTPDTFIETQDRNSPKIKISNVLVNGTVVSISEISHLKLSELNGWGLFLDEQFVKSFKNAQAFTIKRLIESNLDVFHFYESIVIDYNTQKVSDPDFNFACYKSTYPAELTANNIVTLLERTIAKKSPSFSLSFGDHANMVSSHDLVTPDTKENLDIFNFDPSEISYTAEIYFSLDLQKPLDKFDEILTLNVKFVDEDNQDIFSFSSTDDWLNDKATMQATWREYSVRMKNKYLTRLAEMKAKIEEITNV